MSCTTVTRSRELSDTDSERSKKTYRHPYNTRANTNRRAQSRCRSTDRYSPVFISNRESDPCLNQEVPSMDHCFDPYQAQRSSGRNVCCQFLTILAYLILFACILYVGWSFYIMREELTKIEVKLKQLSGNKKEDPHEQLLKDLNQKCVETLKLLLKDPVGRPDFALESSGGRIIYVDAISYTMAPKKFLGFTLCEGQNTAVAMIRATSSPGECWAFQGQSASAIIQLIDHVLIDAITLEHIPRTLSPSGTIDSAPKNFKIWGLSRPDRSKRLLLGESAYENDGTTLQTFKINTTSYYKYIEFEVLSNHGNKEYTCVYRIRVHGTLRKSE